MFQEEQQRKESSIPTSLNPATGIPLTDPRMRTLSEESTYGATEVNENGPLLPHASRLRNSLTEISE